MAAATNGAQKRCKTHVDGHSFRSALRYFFAHSVVGSERIPDLDYVPSVAAPNTTFQSLTGAFLGGERKLSWDSVATSAIEMVATYFDSSTIT